MKLLARKQKVHTTESAPLTTSEDVGVEGKRYPTHALGRFIVRRPLLTFATVLLPLVFFLIGCTYYTDRISFSLDDYQIRSSMKVQRDAIKVNAVLDAWALTLSGTPKLEGMVDTLVPRTTVEDTMELRATIRLDDLVAFAKARGWSDGERDKYANFLAPTMAAIYQMAENSVTSMNGYESVCFTNNLRGGVINKDYPSCAPVSSISQYIFPVWHDNDWYMDGTGDTTQLDYNERLFANPSYGWYFDNNFSTLNVKAFYMRSQFTFASDGKDSMSAYRKRMQAFLPAAMNFVNSGKAATLPFVSFYLGGGSSQNFLAEVASNAESYKVGIAFIICFVLSWWHCGTFVVGLYTVGEAMFAYMGALCVYVFIYGMLPLTTYSAIIWVMTFCMHGTLSFYDMFVFSGVMATKGRQNNLTVVQRLCFTIRRASLGVWVADVLAIVIFAINTTSIFRSVEQFSVFMIIALLWNMFCIVLPTPALVVVHHLYFSNRRRNLQKQQDALNAALLGCGRSKHLMPVLEAVQNNIAEGERTYWASDGTAQANTSPNDRGFRQRYGGVADFLRHQFRAGVDKFVIARHDAVGALHKIRKTKEQFARGQDASDQVEMPAFTLQDFLHLGEANPLSEETGAEAAAAPTYYNPRMVLPSDLIHIPAVFVERSEECWAGLCSALGQASHSDAGDVVSPHVDSLKDQGTEPDDVRAFKDRWNEVGTRMGVETTVRNRTSSLVPLAVRRVMCAQDPTMVISAFEEAGAGHGAATVDDAAIASGPTGFGISKLRFRWSHRAALRRSGCFGLFGKVMGESSEQRMQRLMARKVRRDGYSLFERLLLNYYLPAIHFARYTLTAALVLLFIIACAVGSHIHAAGLPTTLLAGQQTIANTFAAMNDAFGQRGTCTFCGPYYQSKEAFRDATASDIAVCEPKFGLQMNLFVDSCGVCNGTNACVDCAGTPNGFATMDNCGGCSVAGSAEAALCTCPLARDCPYCEWALNQSSAGGGSCSVTCDANTCGRHGVCNQYSGLCDCAAGFSGAACSVCAAWLLPIASNPDCTQECSASKNTELCNCSFGTGRCQSCPLGRRGFDCSQPLLDCGTHGTFTLDGAQGSCVCDSGWMGLYCNTSTACSGRGVLLSASESPTGKAMCGCVGHWRGGTCQLCDCRNGGMCNSDTGECECVGAFTGPRCETCSAECVLHGTCPTVTPPNYALWNVRTCIVDACSESDVDSETMCSACMTGTDSSQTCRSLNQASCMSNSNCWWSTSSTAGTPSCVSAVEQPDSEPLFCTCDNPSVWSGATCGSCSAPPGATCLDSGEVLACNGLTYRSASTAVRLDRCGVCGGNGLCRGCDGVPGSRAVYDACGVCGGNNTCQSSNRGTPLYVDYLFDLTGLDKVVDNSMWCRALAQMATSIRLSDSSAEQKRTVVEDYIGNNPLGLIHSLADFYNYTASNGRLDEAIFGFSDAQQPVSLRYIRYRVQSTLATTESSARRVVAVYNWIDQYLVSPYETLYQKQNMSIYFTSPLFQTAVAEVGALQSLWFAVGIGLAVTFVFLFVYYVSLTTALAATLATGVMCFGSLTVSLAFGWEADAVLQVCVSCTVPIGVEYLVHFCSGYFDYLQTTTSHLFARDVTRRAAVQGALLRSAPALCTSVVCVILVSIMFDVSDLMPSRRAGQLSITLHLLVVITGVLFTGTLAAFGPMKMYQHWTISSILCVLCAVLAAISVLIMYACDGVLGPHANKILTH